MATKDVLREKIGSVGRDALKPSPPIQRKEPGVAPTDAKPEAAPSKEAPKGPKTLLGTISVKFYKKGDVPPHEIEITGGERLSGSRIHYLMREIDRGISAQGRAARRRNK